MTPEQFTYWLQGYMEIHHPSCKSPTEIALTEQQVQIIRDHLKTVFDKKTPERIIYTTTDPIVPNSTDPYPFGSQPTVIC